MIKTVPEKETTIKEIPQKSPTFYKKGEEEQSDKDTEISNIDSAHSPRDHSLSVIQLISSDLSDFITQKVRENAVIDLSGHGNSIFDLKKIPPISIEKYLNRIQKYTHLEDSTLVIALIYIDRLLGNNIIKLSMYNVHKILLTAVVLAIKYNEDEIHGNNYLSKILGVKSKIDRKSVV